MVNQALSEYQQRAEVALEASLDRPDVPPRLLDAMRYSALSGGKRIRALLVYAAGLALNAPVNKLDSVAAAIECIHAYSLIHDDLPAMDDDELRRGKPTNHIQFDEATAILAGDALQTVAVEIITKSDLTDHQVRSVLQILSSSAGPQGMVGGQMLDILATQKSLTLEQLENVHRRKTGALINAAVLSGALCADQVSATQWNALEAYADRLGLAFQVVDDILDIERSTEELGKPNGSDLALGKSTYPALIGLAESKELAQTLYREAMESIALIGDNNALPDSANLLKDLAALVVERTK